MIEFTDDQKKAIAAAQEKFTDLKDKVDSLSDDQLNLLFGEARSMNGWQDKDVSDDTLNQLYSLTKMGPTSTNCCPARFIFIKSDEQKLLIKEALLPNNVDKCMTAPVRAIIGYDLSFLIENITAVNKFISGFPLYIGATSICGKSLPI